MKKAILLALVLFLTTTAFSQGVLKLFDRSQTFFALLEQEKFDEAYTGFSTDFQAKVSKDKLKQVWYSLSAQLGVLVEVNLVSSKTEGDYSVVTVDVKFDKDVQNFLLAFDKSEKMVWFTPLPKKVNRVYSKPTYGDTALYKETEVQIKTPGHTNALVGVLTQPKGASNFPIVVMVHGSGPSDMDATVGSNRPFKDLAAGLADKGIASIRYVKRTMVYPGEFSGAFTVKEEVLDDAVAAVALAQMIPGVNKQQIYLLGHSLGGMLAPRLATLVPNLNGLILLGAPARNLIDLSIDQNTDAYSLSKDTTVAGKNQITAHISDLQKVKGLKPGLIKPDSVVFGLPASYWIDLNQYDQVGVAKKLKQRIFVGQGGYDFQVSMKDYNLWMEGLGKKKNATLKLYPTLNHLMTPQKEKGTVKQYEVPSNVSVDLINDISTWIKTK